MRRRQFLSASAAAGMATAAPADQSKPSWFQLTWYYMRNGNQVERTTQYLRDVWLPASKRLAIQPVGFFNAVIAERSPFLLALASYPSLAAMETALAKFPDDKEFQKGWDEYNSASEPPYIRMESSLLRAFPGMAALEVPPFDGKRAARIFELRTYESNNEKASQRKVGMFENGEIAIFRKVGMTPVFFGQTIVGQSRPNITYMLTFDDLATRDRLWRSFGSDPEWQKLRAQPGLSDAEIVSSISNSILRPTAFSPIK
jgi:hypothetical protein